MAKLHQIVSAIQTGSSMGMMTMEKSLKSLSKRPDHLGRG